MEVARPAIAEELVYPGAEGVRLTDEDRTDHPTCALFMAAPRALVSDAYMPFTEINGATLRLHNKSEEKKDLPKLYAGYWCR